MNKLAISIIILFFMIGIGTQSTAKYISSHLFIIGNIKIDREQPRIEIKSIKEQKDNQTVNFRIKIIENNITYNILNNENIILKINNGVSSPTNISSNNIKVTKVLEENDGITYDISVNCSGKDKTLSLIIKDSIIMDIAGQGNKQVEFTYTLNNN